MTPLNPDSIGITRRQALLALAAGAVAGQTGVLSAWRAAAAGGGQGRSEASPPSPAVDSTVYAAGSTVPAIEPNFSSSATGVARKITARSALLHTRLRAS